MGCIFTHMAYRAALVTRHLLGRTSYDGVPRMDFFIRIFDVPFPDLFIHHLVLGTGGTHLSLRDAILDSRRFFMVFIKSSVWIGALCRRRNTVA